MPLAFLASLRPQRRPIRFTGEIRVNFFCQVLGAPIPLLRAHAVARTQCACQKFVLDQYGDHVLTCKKHTGAITSHDHVMNVSVQLARNSRLRVCIDRKVATTAAHSNKPGDVQAMEFGIPGYNNLVWDVSLVSDRIGSIAFAPAILSVADKIHPDKIRPEFLRLLWVLADMQRSSTSISLGTKRTSGMSDSSGVGLAHSAIIGMQLALPLHTLQPYALICRYMAPLTP